MADDRTNEIDWDRLDRYVRGVGDADERAKLEQWVNESPERRALADSMRNVGRHGSAKFDAHRALGNVQRQLGMNEAPTPIRRATPRGTAVQRPTKSMPIVIGAAAAVVIAAATLVWRLELRPSNEPRVPPREFVTVPGQRASFRLGDGSLVRLSADSKLTVPGDLGTARNRAREVSLTGEAFFVVQHDSTRPFTVRTPYGTAEDLGTEFAVNTYPEMHGMRLAVREGRVAIRPDVVASTATAPRDSGLVAILERGDVARVATDGGISITRRQDMTALFAGAEGTLSLQDVPLREAIPMLERWFNVKIQVDEEPLLGRRVSGTFHDETARAALDVIALALERAATWNGTQARLHPRGDRR